MEDIFNTLLKFSLSFCAVPPTTMAFLTQIAQAVLPHLAPLTAQRLTVNHLDWMTTLGYTADLTRVPPEDPVTVMGLRFPNRIGLAAGFDPTGRAVSALGSFGFGHIEIGTVRPQNFRSTAPHRIRRFNKEEAITVSGQEAGIPFDALRANLKSAEAYALRGGILGLNLSLKDASPERLVAAAALADYCTLAAEDLPPDAITQCLARVKAGYSGNVPLVLKLSADMEESAFLRLLDTAAENVDGLILTGPSQIGTVAGHELTDGTRLSGAPLKERALRALTLAADHLKGDLPLIASGGILSEKDCLERLEAGASLVQLFSGFVFKGPKWVADCVDAAARWAQKN